MLLSEYLKILLDYSKLLLDYPESPRLFLKSDAKIRQIKLAFSVYVSFRPFPSVFLRFLPFSSVFVRQIAYLTQCQKVLLTPQR